MGLCPSKLAPNPTTTPPASSGDSAGGPASSQLSVPPKKNVAHTLTPTPTPTNTNTNTNSHGCTSSTARTRWEKVLIGIPVPDRELIQNIYRVSVPCNLDPADGLALVSVLLAVGLVPRDDNDDDDDDASCSFSCVDEFASHAHCKAPGWSYGLDDGDDGNKNNTDHYLHRHRHCHCYCYCHCHRHRHHYRHHYRRIERLSLGGSRYNLDGIRDLEHPFDLPPGIAHLDRLRELVVIGNCRLSTLPDNLGRLTCLEKLLFQRCDWNSNPNPNPDSNPDSNPNPNPNSNPDSNSNLYWNQRPAPRINGVVELGLGLDLRNLKTIAIIECKNVGSSSWSHGGWGWVADSESLPNLRCLQFGCLPENETDALLDTLADANPNPNPNPGADADADADADANADADAAASVFPRRCSFRERLRALVLDSCSLEDRHLERLLLDVVPGFPRMTHLRLSRNGIESFVGVANRLAPLQNPPVSSLREVCLGNNPCLERLRDGGRGENEDERETERAALLRVLESLDTIGSLEASSVHPPGDYSCYGSEAEYALSINRAGKSLLIRNGAATGGDSGGRASSSSGSGSGSSVIEDFCLFPSLWPRLLERASVVPSPSSSHDTDRGRESNTNTNRGNVTGLYYLLRNSPSLLTWNGTDRTTVVHPPEQTKQYPIRAA
eukprot:jgi/Psemu1/10161/gm1.10161_g